MFPFFKRFAPEIGWLICLAAALALIRSGARGKLDPLRQLLDRAAAPVSGSLAAGRLKLRAALTGWERIALARQNTEGLELAQLRAGLQAQELIRLRDELARSEAALRLQAALPLKTRGARLLTLNLGPEGHAGLIRGEDLAGMDGHALLAAEGILGRTLSCSGRDCRVILNTDPEFGIGVINARSRLLLTAEGNGTEHLILRGISTGDDVKSGDALISSGLDGLYPRGLPLGVVTGIDAVGENGPEARVKPAARPGNGLVVLVVE